MKMLSTTFLLLLTIGFGTIDLVSSSKILFVTPMATKSHKNVFDPLIDALALRGHELTVISPLKSSQVPSVREIVPLPLESVMGSLKNPIQMRKDGGMSILTSLNMSHFEFICDQMYENVDVKQLMANEKFDLILMNGFVNKCTYGLIWTFSAPLILITSMPAPQIIASSVGNNFPSSFVPEPFLPLSDKMNFWQRMQNLVFQVVVQLGVKYSHDTKMEGYYKKYLPGAPPLSQMDEDTSMIFMNSHFSLNSPRPLLPAIVEVGGMHCRDGQQLPKDLDEFLSGAEHGFILFSMGSIIKGENMPEQARKSLLNVFSRLKQRVLWKWDAEMPEKLPANVKISNWVPQQDVLAHKNIRIFITHGGLLSTQEAVFHGVPIIGIPVFADQDLNMLQAEKFGYCLTLEILDLTEDKLEKAINRILNEKQFAEKAKSLSRIYRDQPESALERAVFWTEYVLRHKGAAHMQSSAKHLNFIQYHSIDVIAFLLGVILAILWLVKFLLWNIFVCRILGGLFSFGKSSANRSKTKNGLATKKNK